MSPVYWELIIYIIQVRHFIKQMFIYLSMFVCFFVCLFDGVSRHFQQYISYIMAVSYIDEVNRRIRRKQTICHKSLINFIT